uniref:Uncharacterized protein n=1 Tax=Arundo donax TaxID=35708 RepID=A0A0A9F2I5_ARUDO
MIADIEVLKCPSICTQYWLFLLSNIRLIDSLGLHSS